MQIVVLLFCSSHTRQLEDVKIFLDLEQHSRISQTLIWVVTFRATDRSRYSDIQNTRRYNYYNYYCVY